MATPCQHCDCTFADEGGVHALLAMLGADDLDAALERGLLTAQPCPHCSEACAAILIAARDARTKALAARARYLSRGARLQRRKAERELARIPTPSLAARTPALPAAAADALSRALAKAAERKPR